MIKDVSCLSYQIQQALSGQPIGTILIRWSESAPGQFAIAYVGIISLFLLLLRLISFSGHEMEPKHYLVLPEDIAAKSLADFICEKDQFQSILQVFFLTSSFISIKCVGFENGSPKFKLAPKHPALSLFISQSAQSPAPPERSGYDPLENPWEHIASRTFLQLFFILISVEPATKRFKGSLKRPLL